MQWYIKICKYHLCVHTNAIQSCQNGVFFLLKSMKHCQMHIGLGAFAQINFLNEDSCDQSTIKTAQSF